MRQPPPLFFFYGIYVNIPCWIQLVMESMKGKTETKRKKFAIQWLAHVSIIIIFFFLSWGFYGVGNQFKMNGREMKMTKNKSFSFSSRTVSAHCDARLALSTGTAARMVS